MSVPASEWPRPGQRVELQVGDEPELLAVVDDVCPPDLLHLREPFTADGRTPPGVALGTCVLLTWTTAAGRHELRATLSAVGQGAGQLWWLDPQGVPELTQRRQFIRVRDMLRVRLRRGADEWSATLYDLSEGGARFVVLAPNDLCAGDHVRLELELEARSLLVPAMVLQTQVEDGRTTVRVCFHDLRREADLLRRRVIDLQRRARAAGLQ